jgi:PAS domain S-box-containing protein
MAPRRETSVEKEALYDRVIKDLPVGFSMVDREGNITEFNRVAEEITGYRKKEVLGKPHLETLHGTSDAGACPLFRRTMRHRKKSISAEARIRKKDGEEMEAAVTSYPLYDSGGAFLGGVELFRDITEQKRHERERRNFLSMFVHDMKKPVLTSRGFLSRMLSEKAGPLTEKQREYLDIMGEGLERLEAFIGDFLEYSRFEARAYRPELKPLRVDGLLREELRAFRAAAEEKGVAIELETRGKVPKVRADEGMISRVLANLLENAIKYTPAGGKIKVRCGGTDKALFVEVSNPGGGIPEDELPRIFDAFHRAEGRGAKQGGTGLGLAIAKQIVRLHGGKIRARVTPGGETVLSFTLPAGQ